MSTLIGKIRKIRKKGGSSGPHVHADAHKGEKEACAKAAVQSESLKQRILNRLDEVGPDGLTPDEFVKETNTLINTIRRRFTDLWKEGKICHHSSSLHRTNKAGNDCIVWVLGCDPNRAKNRAERSGEKIARLEAELETCKGELAVCRERLKELGDDGLAGTTAG
jgi:hypothetical protein